MENMPKEFTFKLCRTELNGMIRYVNGKTIKEADLSIGKITDTIKNEIAEYKDDNIYYTLKLYSRKLNCIKESNNLSDDTILYLEKAEEKEDNCPEALLNYNPETQESCMKIYQRTKSY